MNNHVSPRRVAGRPPVTDNARDEEPLAWCPGCGDRILRLIKQAQNYNAEADRHASRVVAMEAENEDLTAERDALAARLAAIRADIAAAISARRTGIRKPTGYDEGWDDALDIAEQIALGELR